MAARIKAASNISENVWRLSAVVVLGVLVVVSSISVAYVTYQSRVLLDQLQKLKADKDHMDVEWGQLLLEQSTASTHGKVERVARTQLGMHLPAHTDIVVVQP